MKRGPSGVIASNRPDGVAVAQYIAEDFGSGDFGAEKIGAEGSKPGRKSLEKLLSERNVRVVSYDDRKSIEAPEFENADGEHPRKKFVTIREMLDVLE